MSGVSRRTAQGLLLSCHPVPSAAVTLMTAGLIALAGASAGRIAIGGLAMLATQVSIGWCNDANDADRDKAVRRTDKPVALGTVSLTEVWTAAILAGVAAILIAGALGLTVRLLIVLGVACGWSYNLRLKATVWSWAPYAVAFGLLPAIATQSRAHAHWPGVWAPLAGALFGVAAHFTNVLPDVLDDEAQGIRGLPHRLGARRSAILGPLLLAIASAVILFGSGQGSAVLHGVGLVLALGASLWAALAGARKPGSRVYFLAVIAVVGLDLIFFALAGSSLR